MKRMQFNNRLTAVRGFTLTELLIAMVIASILVMIAVPSYQSHVEKVRRSDAYSCLMDGAQRQENFFYQNNTYTTDLAALGMGAAPVSCGDGGNYNLTAAAGATGIGSSYVLTATRVAPQTSDTKCGDLTLNSTGAKGNTNASLPPGQCW